MNKKLIIAVAAALALAPKASARDAVVIWTAPGDDGMVGRATSYELRMKTVPIAGTDTLSWWNNSATVITGVPSVAGAKDSALVAVLDPVRDYYFVIVAVDDAGNRSFYSNVAKLLAMPTPDTARPAAVRSLGVTGR